MYCSTFSRPAQDPTTLDRFQLAQFSYTITSNGHRGPFNWNHVYGNGDIVGILEKCTTPSPGKVVLKVLHGHDTLEEINITELAKELKSQIHSKQDGPKVPAVSVVVRSPCLAIKYPLVNSRLRRFQIKFSHDRDYYSVLSTLSEVGCPFSELNATSEQRMRRPNSSHPNLGRIGSVSTGFPIACETSTPNISLSRYFTSNPQTSAVSDTHSAITHPLPSSSSNSTTLAGSNRIVRTSTLNASSTLPSGAIAISEMNTSFTNIPSKELSTKSRTATGSHDIEDLDLPPTRELPFRKPAAKRARKLPKTADATRSKTSTTELKQAPKTENGRSKAPESQYPTQTSRGIDTNHSRPTTTAITDIETTTIEPSPLPSASIDLTGYLSNPTKERTAKIEDWICTHLEDDNFLQLCADVEGVWRRFALGK
ncbi:uncharacterized protein BJX67DRAFT_345943 [Aspergillus lucknowensis]|uniref:Uncharacterized protein n=1 Tax=Aspergillus lucknowensis TaxID=176173 RepID=A0ABR4M1A4_9EURO